MNYRKEYYKELLKKHSLPKKYFKNALMAFLFGGTICLLGELLLSLYGLFLAENKTLMLLTMIAISSILSGFGVYDKIGQIAKCGTIIPITGFANSMTSASLEYKPEGYILGVGANTFKLAGTVIVFGVLSAFIVAFIKYLGVLL